MLSEKIYKLRRKSGLSQEQLAEKIGVSRQAISKWEGGSSTPELDKLMALSEFFNLTIDELTSEQDINADTVDKERKTVCDLDKSTESKIGIGMCLMGAACLCLLGIFMLIQTSAFSQINESSVITLNGTGILVILFVLFMVIGMVMILKKK